ncbi:MAG TPA: adenylate/guanylate cyclase domain-containing protein [Spirochaetota bacterium]|nr:adenylate/guanylate cyclase domain-containing protein [Spirochaetota bacterium]
MLLKKRNKKSSKKNNPIRKVYFGLRLRLILVLSVVLLIVLLIFTAFMIYNQTNIMSQEKNEKATILAQNLSNIFEWYLDKSKHETIDDTKQKLKLIKEEITKFKNNNQDILYIFLYDYYNKIAYKSTQINITKEPYYKVIKSYLTDRQQKLITHDYNPENDISKNNKFSKNKQYKVVLCPVIAKTGILMQINEDFDTILLKSHTQSFTNDEKKKSYIKMWVKYNELLPDKFDPKNIDKKNDTLTNYNLDIIFLQLYKNIFSIKKNKVEQKDLWLLNEKWILHNYTIISRGILNKDIALIKKYDDIIIDNLKVLRDYGEKFKHLGTLIVVYDLNQIQSDIYKSLSNGYITALSIYIISILVIFWITGIMLKNIKKLEKWALDVGKGNFSLPVDIKNNDEIGRLSDVFQYMINEINSKYHLEKFVSRSTRHMIGMAGFEKIDVGFFDRRNFAFLFSDIRGFTSFSEINDPETVMSVLNLYFDKQAKIIQKYKGDIDDFVGDQIMAHFGGTKKADTAITVALGIMKEIDLLNKERKSMNLPIFEIGIGIHVGDVVIGKIGAEFRMDLACIGDVVNTTSRLCQNAQAGEIIVSKSTINEITKTFKYKKLEPVKLKGKKDPLEVYSVKWES